MQVDFWTILIVIVGVALLSREFLRQHDAARRSEEQDRHDKIEAARDKAIVVEMRNEAWANEFRAKHLTDPPARSARAQACDAMRVTATWRVR